MFDYLQQFNNLPKNLRELVSSADAIATISELEDKYKVDLAIIVMKVMIKSLSFANLPSYLSQELLLAPETANNLVRELKERLFAPLADYLGLTSDIRALDIDKEIEIIIKEAGLVLPSIVSISRFKNIISTYTRGIRNKIDTRNTLAKDVKIGGLNLTEEEINRVLKICDTRIAKSSSIAPLASAAPISAPTTKLDKIIGGTDKTIPATAEYDLKKSLAKGETKSIIPAPLDTKHELAKPGEQLDLPKPVVEVKPKIELKPKLEVKPITPVIPTPIVPVVPVIPVAPEIPIAPVARPVSRLEPIRPMAPKMPATPIIPKTAPVSPAAARTLAGRQAPPPSAIRPQMHDIKPMPKVMGPIEELQFLDVVNFRRLGATPADITAKVFSKIKLLEKDGYDKMVAGVRAWRQSPVCRLYLRLGQEAIAKGRPMKEIAEARQSANQDYLSMDEIEAIVTLNGKLVF